MDSMVTLFMAITGGVNWEECYLPLSAVSMLAQGLMHMPPGSRSHVLWPIAPLGCHPNRFSAVAHLLDL